tara:strand:- start:100 stop:471 length:372 start_codon:yes stop_codon:yes gene_type:complete
MNFNEQILETNSNIIKSYTDSSITVLDKEYNYNVIVPPEKSIIKCNAKAKGITDSFILNSLSDNADFVIIASKDKDCIDKTPIILELNKRNIGCEMMNLSSACSCHNILLAEKRNFLSFFIFN